MKIAVIGAGAVGLTVAATFAVAGAEVHLVARGRSAQALNAQGIHVTGALGDHAVPRQNFVVHESQQPVAACDVIAVATKATDISTALQPFAAIFSSGAKRPVILLLQNGWGSAQEVKQILPAETPVFSGSLLTGIERRSLTEININVHGDVVRVGSLFDDRQERIRPMIDLLQRGFLPFAWEPSIEQVLLKKLLYNLCLNPLSALLKCTYGELGKNDYTVGLMQKLADEAVKVIAATRGSALYKNGADYVMNDLIPNRLVKTAAHRSSMLQDIEAGRKTEILYMNGAISKMGKECGIEPPCNDMIVSLILALESMNFRPYES